MASKPEFKKGDTIIVTVSRNGAPEGVVLEIISRTGSSYMCQKEGSANGGAKWNVYHTKNGGPIDEFIAADRKTRAEYLKKKVEEMKTTIKEHKRDIDILENFESEEAYVTHKIQKILENKDDVEALTETLKLLKKSNIL